MGGTVVITIDNNSMCTTVSHDDEVFATACVFSAAAISAVSCLLDDLKWTEPAYCRSIQPSLS